MRYNQTASIRNHYNVVSPYYRSMWGPHIHHGLWNTGREAPVDAQESLIRELVLRAGIRKGARILDAGCGTGGSSVYLARHLDANVTGITLSPVQVEMAQSAAAAQGVTADFQLMDAQDLHFGQCEQFDCIWSIEAISHFARKELFFAQATALLVPGGVFALTDWFANETLSTDKRTEFLEPIERGMLIDLQTLGDYREILGRLGNTVEQTVDLSVQVAPTWDICLDIIEDQSLWNLAQSLGPEFVSFLESFAAMKNGYETKALEYHLIIARKPVSFSASGGMGERDRRRES